jgi:hypothetical protein
MHLKHPVIYLLMLIAVIFVGDRLLSLCLDQLVIRSNTRLARLYSGRAASDIVVLGNSRANRAFFSPYIEKTLERKTVNLSYNALSTELASALMEDFLERNGKPQLLIVEVTGIVMAPEAINELKLYSNRSDRLAKIFKREKTSAYYTSKVMNLFRLNGAEVIDSLQNLRSSDQTAMFRTPINDFLIKQVEAEPSVRFPENGMERMSASERREIRDKNLKALTSIVQIARAQMIDLRLIVAPYWPRYRDKIEDWDQVLSEIQAATLGEPIWDYSSALIDPIDFGDRVHLTNTGSIHLVNLLEQDGFFAPHALPKAKQ